MFLLFSYGYRVWIEEVSHSGIAANQTYSLKGVAGAAFFEQPEQTLDCDIHHIVSCFLAGGAVNDVSYSFHRRPHRVAVRNVSFHSFQAAVWLGNPVVAERSDAYILVRIGMQNLMTEIGANFAGGASDQDVFHAFAIENSNVLLQLRAYTLRRRAANRTTAAIRNPRF